MRQPAPAQQRDDVDGQGNAIVQIVGENNQVTIAGAARKEPGPGSDQRATTPTCPIREPFSRVLVCDAATCDPFEAPDHRSPTGNPAPGSSADASCPLPPTQASWHRNRSHPVKARAKGKTMISTSVPLMTVIDLLIMALTAYAIWRTLLTARSKRPSAPQVGLRLIALGLLAVALFYFADLLSMYVLPVVTSKQETTAFMGALHRNLSWLVILFAMITICTGSIELNRTQIELRELASGLEAKVGRLVDSNIIGIFIWGLDGRITDANEAFLRIVGYGRDDLVSGRMGWRELTPAEWRDADDRRVAELKATGTVQPYEKEYFQKSGSRVPVLVGAANFEAGRDEGVAFVVDLTDRKRAEKAVRESERRYREVEMGLAHASRVTTMGQLSASIAHEVNQPIAAAVTNAHAALRWLGAEPPNLEEVRQALGRIVKNGNRATDVIGRIRAFVSKAPPRKDSLEINQVILEVIALTRSEVEKNGISMQTQLAEDLPLIQGDRIQLQQVILNLIINAVEAISGLGEGSRGLLISAVKARSDRVRRGAGFGSGPGSRNSPARL